MTVRDAEIVVAGAGPVGLAAAISLHQAGRDAVLVSPQRPADERTSALLAGSVAFLESAGIWPGVLAQAAPLASLRIVDATRRLIRAPEVLFHAAEIDLDQFGFNVANRDLIAALEATAERLGLRRIAAAVEDARWDEDAAILALSGGGTIAAKLVVAADGRRSRLRELAGIGTDEWRYPQAALVANLGHARGHEDTSTEFHYEGGPFTLVPLPGRRSSLVWVDEPAAIDRAAALPPAELAATVEERSFSLLGEVAIDGSLQVFPLSGMTAGSVRSRRLVLVGEAAHVVPPIGAQGLNLGYRDVAALGRLLAGAGDPGGDDLLAAYERARRADVLTRTLAVDALNRTLLTGFLPAQALRGAGLFLLDRVPALRRAVMRQGVAG
ncbi:MAG TPA: UbiH/UbiF family hydroxylase [Bauldia sp.]|nr:UbiH/UbiF family hydroxylase [Bauldia sp.]